MKTVGIFIALFLWSLIVGELLGSALLGQGIVIRLSSFEPASVDDVARMMASVIIDVGSAMLLSAIVTPLALWFRRTNSVKISAAITATAIIIPIALVVAFSNDAFSTRNMLALVSTLFQCFLVAFAAAHFWPKHKVNVQQVFE